MAASPGERAPYSASRGELDELVKKVRREGGDEAVQELRGSIR